jgi:hypothetical protein
MTTGGREMTTGRRETATGGKERTTGEGEMIGDEYIRRLVCVNLASDGEENRSWNEEYRA